MPGLVRGMARTAAVVGTATATRNAVNRRQADKNAQAYAQAEATYAQTAQQAAPPPPQEQYAPPPPAPAPQEDMITQLERLGSLKAQGLLTDEEFAAAKQQLLAS
jgi:Short C-terminal domain